MTRRRRASSKGARTLGDRLSFKPIGADADAIAVMHEKYGIACDMMHGFKWDKWTGQMSNVE